MPNKLSFPEKFAGHVMLAGCPQLYQNKLQEQGVQDVVNRNKIKFEPYGDLVDQFFSQFNENLINNQDPHSQIENDEIPEVEYPNENDSEDTERNKISAVLNFMPQVLLDDEIEKGINSLNSKQREVCNVVHTWTKSFAKCDGHDVEPMHIFLSDSGGTDKSNLVRVISKTLLYNCKDSEKPRVLLLGPTGISAVSIGGTTIRSGLAIKPRTKLIGFNGKSKAILRNRVSEVKLLIIDELLMVSSNLWTGIDSRLGVIFMMIPEKAFSGLSVMAVADLIQLPAVGGKPIYSQYPDEDSMKHLLGLKLWHLFKYLELTEVLRENDKFFIDLLNKVRIGNIDDDVENLLKARFICESDENYPKDALDMYAENEPSMQRNEAVLKELSGELYIIEGNDKITDNCKYPLALIQAAQNQKQTNTGGLAKLLKLKIGANVMLIVNIDMLDRLLNCQTAVIRHEFAESSARKVYIKFSDEQTGSKAMRSSYLGRQNLGFLLKNVKLRFQ